MSEHEHEQAFVQKVKAALDESSENLDAHTLSRLRRARHRALQADRRGTAWTGHGWRIPAAGVVTASVAVLSVMLYFGLPSDIRLTDEIEDADILASKENLEISIDLDFYTWLAEEQEHAG